MLVQAYEELKTCVDLVMAGGSAYSDAYAEELRSHANPRIHWIPWASGAELDHLLTNAMLFVLPSDLEGLSLALLDAMGAGVCVLTSDIPENREVVEGAGFTFKNGNAADLQRMLRWLIDEGPARRAAAQKGQERVRQRYLWPQIAQQIESVYQSVTAPERGRRLPIATARAKSQDQTGGRKDAA